MILIDNNGRDIASTNFWQSEHALRGLCYLSGNDGAWRLLVPAASQYMLDEMRTGERAIIEPSIRNPACWDIVFDDGSDAPFSLSLDKRMVDRSMSPGDCVLTVWTADGKVLETTCLVRTP